MKISLSKKSIGIGLVLLILVFFAIHIYKARHASPTFEQEAIIVEVGNVKKGSIPIQEQVVGTLIAARSVQITSEMGGQVATILAHDGEFVEALTPIIQLDDTVSKAKAESSKANLSYSEGNYRRMQLLLKKGAVSQQAVDQALADLKEKKAIEKENRVYAEKMLIRAPFAGVLGKMRVNMGEHISIGQPLVTLTDVKNLRVEFNISEKYLSKLKVGQQVTLKTSAYPDKEFYGKVAFVSPTINTEDRTLSIYADVPNQDQKLAPGLFVNVLHIMGEEKNALLIPSISLMATIDGQQVFKVEKGKAVAVSIKVGQRTLDEVQVIDGLSAGDIVITGGQHKVRDGSSVKVKT